MGGTMQSIADITDDRFDVRRRLGAGGFGEVFEVWDRARSSVVALKRLKRLTPESVRRFKREFRSLAGLSHPNLVQLYELVSDGEEWAFTMELVHGLDFATALRGDERNPGMHPTVSELNDARLEARGPELEQRYEPARVRGALRQLVRGVRALHAAGKLHRDLKPHNVLVTDEGRVVILDFGMVRELARPDVVDPTAFAGTPHYMAPEQAGHASVTVAADWYSVGVMLYEVLVGAYPVQGRTVVQLLLRKQMAAAPDDAAFPLHTPADLRRACQALLALDPAERAGADELFDLLGESREASAPIVAVRDADIDGPLIGRDPQLLQIESCRQSVAQHAAPQIVALVGPSGIGKSALGWHFAAARAGSRPILASRCWENESVPYKAMDGIVDALVLTLSAMPDEAVDLLLGGDVAALARVFPAFEQLAVVRDFAAARPSSSDTPSTRRAAFHALRGILRQLSVEDPLTLYIDDAQWGDRDSARALLEILNPPQCPSLLLLLSYRDAEAAESPFLTTLLGEGHTAVTTIALEPLTESDASKLALAWGASDDRARRIAAESHGDPYLVQQLAESEASAGTTVEETVLRRLAALDSDDRAFVETLAVAGKPIDAAVVHAAAAIQTDVTHLVAKLRNERLLRSRSTSAGSPVEPYHDRIRQTLRRQLAPGRRRSLHLRLAQTLERVHNKDAELLALHFREGGEPGRSAPYAREAADLALEMLAYDRAASGYADALRDGHWGDGDLYEMQVRLGTVLSYLGRGNESAEAFVRAAVHGDQIESIALRRRAAEQLLRAGQFVRGLELLDTVLRELGVDAPRSEMRLNLALVGSSLRSWVRGFEFQERDELLDPLEAERIDTIWAAANLMGTLDVKRGVYFTFLNSRQSLDSGEADRVGRTLALQAVHSASRASTRARTEGLLDTAQELVPRSEDPLQAGAIVDFFRGMAAYMQGDVRTSHRCFADVERALSRRTSRFVWERKLVEIYDVYNQYHLGQLTPLCAGIAEGARDAAARDDMMQWSGVMTWSHLAHLIGDDPEQARDVVERAARAWHVPDVFLLHDFWRLQAEVRIALYEGRAADALQILDDSWSGMRRGLFLALDLSRGIAFDLRARAHLGVAARCEGAERARQAKAARKDANRLRSVKLRWAGAAAQVLDAQLGLLAGDTGAARASFAQAEAALGALGYETVVAAVRARLGQLPGEPGGNLATRSLQWFSGRGVVDPARFVSMLVPVGVQT